MEERVLAGAEPDPDEPVSVYNRDVIVVVVADFRKL